MPRSSETFWSRVLFRDFIRHFRKMTPEEVYADIEASMDALDDLNPDGESFGSLMVRWANERMNGAFATAARENGKKGGRPRKKQETTAAAATREGTDVSPDRESGPFERTTGCNHYDQEARRAGGNSLRVAKVSTSPARSSGPMPEDKQAVMDYASAAGLDIDDAYECWHVTVNERDGLTADGKPINNWKAYVRKWCATRDEKRRQQWKHRT